MTKTIEVISLIYKSVDYAKFIKDQLDRYATSFDGYAVSYRLFANDATPEVLKYLKDYDIDHSVFTNVDQNEYYMNRVYRAWNCAVYTSCADYICLVNSDMAFSPNWLKNLTKHISNEKILTSRLVESGKMRSGQFGITQYFGHTPKTFKEDEWLEFASETKEDYIAQGGLFMPLLIDRQLFIQSGMYPEGNIYRDGIGTLTGGERTGVVQSGDSFYFYDILQNQYNKQHYTVFDSVVYHFQEGELDE